MEPRALANPERTWSALINGVFNTSPRNGATGFWLPRPKLQNDFSNLLYQDGVHICVDGPSGTGKSSLVTTQLTNEKQKFLPVQLTRYSGWDGFCKEIVEKIKNTDSRLSVEVVAGLKSFLPEASFKVRYGKTTRQRKDPTKKYIGHLFSEVDLCRALSTNQTALYIDDFEAADEHLVVRVADMCKVATQDYKCKIIIVGTNDIFFRLLEAQPALDGRLKELGVGALSSTDDAWRFLCLAFDRLDIVHPQKMYDRGGIPEAQLKECRARVFDAAAALPKTLNEFGRELCLEGRSRLDHLTVERLSEFAKEYFLRKIDDCAREFPRIVESIYDKPEAKMVLEALYRVGIGNVIHIENLFRVADDSLSRVQIDYILRDFSEAEIITRTGRRGEIIFVSNLALAHIFGVAINKKQYYGLSSKLFGISGQLSLPMKLD